MYEVSRGVSALLGAALGGLLLWLATQVNSGNTGGYWAQMGLVAGAGLVLALALAFGSTTRGLRPAFSPGRFLVSFLPVLVVTAWIVIAHQPHANWFRDHVLAWSSDLHIRSFVDDMGQMLAALALATGVVFGFCFDTVPVTRAVPEGEAVTQDADEPVAAERREVVDDPAEPVEPAREPVATPASATDDGTAEM
jgi:hypothetical protein